MINKVKPAYCKIERNTFVPVFPYRKSTFDMFNFLASQHRQLPDINPYDEEEDEVPLKSTMEIRVIVCWPLQRKLAKC